MRDPCECHAELGGIARIVEVSFVFSFKFVMYGGPLWDLCECQAEFGDILQRLVRQMCHFLLYR